MASPRKEKTWQRVADVGFESAFHFLLGRLVHAIARLDFGMGLQLRYWGREDDPKIQELLEPQSAKLKGRLKALERLMKAAWAQPNTEGELEFAQWFKRAHKARGFRNDYAHGRWGVPGKHVEAASGRFCDATPLLVFVPLDWDMSPDRKDRSIDLTLEQFAAQVEQAEVLSSQFFALVEKYGVYLNSGQRLSRDSAGNSLSPTTERV